MNTSSNFINEISISYSKKQFNSKTVNTSQIAHEASREIFECCNCQIELKEYFFIVLLNRANQIIGYHKLSEGGICGTVVDIRLAFATALKGLASAMILVHNHPSGNLTASHQDISITNRFREVGKLMDIQIFDHIILTDAGYLSFADEGLIS